MGIRTISNADIWTRLASGRYIAEHGAPHEESFSFAQEGQTWVDSSWLYDGLLYRLWETGGPSVVTLVHVAFVLAAFLLLLSTARRWAGPVSIALALVLCGWLMAPRFSVRPILCGLFFCAVFIRMLSGKKKAVLLWGMLLPLQVLWTNIHASFLLGPGICLLFAIQAITDAKGNETSAQNDARKCGFSLLLLSAATLLITLLNPYGVALHKTVIGALFSPAHRYVQVWISPFSNHFRASASKHIVTAALLIGAGGLVAQRRKLPLALTALAVVSAFIVVRSMRFTAVFAVLSFPFLCLSLSALGEFIESRVRIPALKAAASVAVVVLCISSVVLLTSNRYYVREGSASAFGLGVEYSLFPEAALQVIENENFPERAFNLVTDGGFLAWRIPQRKIFVDNRAGVYGEDFYRTLFDGLLRGEPESWGSMVEQWHPGAVILNTCARNSGIAARSLLMGGGWALAYFDGTTAIFIEPASHYTDLIADDDTQSAGLQILDKAYRDYRASLESVIQPPVPPRLVGAARFFLALNRYREAGAIYSLLTRGAPSMATAWLSLGICQVQEEQKEAAVTTLERACDLLPKNALCWLWLSRACAQNGAVDAAQQAYDHACHLNPARAEAFGNPLEKPAE